MTTTQITDHRRWEEVLAYRAMDFPNMSVREHLAEIAPDLPEATRDLHFGDLIDGLRLRDAACKACEAEPRAVAQVLTERVNPKVAVRAAGHLLAFVRSTANVVALIAAEDFGALDGLDRNLDGALAEQSNVQNGYLTDTEYGDEECPDPALVKELAQEKVTAVLADFSFRMELQLATRLEQFTVAAWRFTDGARLRLTGGAL